jgi:predicted nucleotidyltransferase component of viral defense system
MIDRQEILALSREMGLEANIIEKDYALGWILAGINVNDHLRTHWIFKGGTCLKKCYFETYRFSEDLDFTVTDRNHFNEPFLRDRFNEVATWIRDKSGLDIALGDIHFEILTNPRGGLSAEGRVPYRGPLARAGDAPRIKLDLTADEVVVRQPQEREVFHPYSDCPADGIRTLCYPFDEIFAEKVRALRERLRPRDLYDVIYIFRNRRLAVSAIDVFHVLGKKCEYKQIAVPTAAIILAHDARPDLEASWAPMLGHQLPGLPSLQDYLGEIQPFFEWLVSTAVAQRPTVGPRIDFAIGGESLNANWTMPDRPRLWGFTAPIEEIRFAAANHLCVELGYNNSQRLIEPYAIRQSSAGNYLLYAVRVDNGELRAYRFDRMQSAKATPASFTPRFPVEIAVNSALSSVPPVTTYSRYRHIPSTPRSRTRRSFGTQIQYVFRCPVCGKLFRRKEYDATLRQHKSKQDWPCYGTFGVFVKQEYSKQ